MEQNKKRAIEMLEKIKLQFNLYDTTSLPLFSVHQVRSKVVL